MIAAEEKALEKLRARRGALAAHLEALAEQVKQLEGATAAAAPAPAKRGRKPGPKPRKKAKAPTKQRKAKKTTLLGAIEDVLAKSGAPLRVAQMAGRLSSAGYKTKSKNLAKMISATLGKSKEIVRTGRGLYTAKGRA